MSNSYKIDFLWDVEAGVWVATSEDVLGLVLEHGSLDALVEKVKVAVPELLELDSKLPLSEHYLNCSISHMPDFQIIGCLNWFNDYETTEVGYLIESRFIHELEIKYLENKGFISRTRNTNPYAIIYSKTDLGRSMNSNKL